MRLCSMGPYMLALYVMLATACSTTTEVVVTPVNEPELVGTLRAFPEVMRSGGVLDENGTWSSPRFSWGAWWNKDTQVEEAGILLLQRLSPSFRYGGASVEDLPPSFDAMRLPDATVSMGNTWFRIVEGPNLLYVSLMAVVDWNRDGIEDWLVLCRVETAHNPGFQREYHLIITDREAAVWEGQLLGIQDCAQGICQPVPLSSTGAADTWLLDFFPGDAPVTAPPQEDNALQENQGESSQFNETRLEN